MKLSVKVSKRIADWQFSWESDWEMILREIKICIRKKVKQVRKFEQATDEMVEYVNGQIFHMTLK